MTRSRMRQFGVGVFFLFFLTGQASAADDGLVSRASKFGVEETLSKIETAARARGLMIFARIDHSGEAQKAGLSMPETKLIILGDPKGGTPLMLAAPGSAIDLPLKVSCDRMPAALSSRSTMRTGSAPGMVSRTACSNPLRVCQG